MNQHRLEQLTDLSCYYDSFDDLYGNKDCRIFKEFSIETKIDLKIGTQVMLIGDSLANGSIGRVIGFFKSG